MLSLQSSNGRFRILHLVPSIITTCSLLIIGCATESSTREVEAPQSESVGNEPGGPPPGSMGRSDPNDRGYAPVRLGIRPGMSGDEGFGVSVQGVSEGTSADDGGIEAGDLIVAWGGEDLIDIMDMLERLREHKPGDVVELVVLRDGIEVELDITMKASDQKIEN